MKDKDQLWKELKAATARINQAYWDEVHALTPEKAIAMLKTTADPFINDIEYQDEQTLAFLDANQRVMHWLEYQQEQSQADHQVAKVDQAFANLEKIEESYRKHFGTIPPVTKRLQGE